MACEEDVTRAQVTALFAKCDSDVVTFMKAIGRSLNEVGRHDIKVDVDPTGTYVTIAQSKTHAQNRKECTFNERLDKLVVPPEMFQEGDVMKEQNERTATVGKSERKPPRCFPYTEKDERLDGFPTSKYTGNYLLKRYGGAFPQHCHYGFYRRFGQNGQGAAGAEFHSYPGGEIPKTDTLYS